MRKVYLVVPTHHIGGAEKRLIQIWLQLYKEQSENLALIISPELEAELVKISEFAGLLTARDSIHTDLISQDSSQSMKNLKSFANGITDASLFHYVLLPPLLKNRRHQYLYTYPSSSFKKYNWKGLVSTWMAFVAADQLDVLSPTIHKQIRRTIPWKAKHIHLTPGSFVDFSLYQAGEYSARRNCISFVGLLSFEKQADRLLKCLPEADQILKAKGIKDPSYNIMGRESDDFKLKDTLNKEHNSLNLKIGFESLPQSVLKSSKIFLSIQQADNYPSKSLLEAMACGALPIVTNTGNSEMIAPKEQSEYIPVNFNAKDLAEACFNILSLNEADYKKRQSELKKFIEKRFSIETSLNYFKKLYWGL